MILTRLRAFLAHRRARKAFLVSAALYCQLRDAHDRSGALCKKMVLDWRAMVNERRIMRTGRRV